MVLEEAGGDDRGGSGAVQAVVREDGVAVQGDLLGTAARASGDVGTGGLRAGGCRSPTRQRRSGPSPEQFPGQRPQRETGPGNLETTKPLRDHEKHFQIRIRTQELRGTLHFGAATPGEALQAREIPS